MGGSSGGARPKILTSVHGEEWLIKFPSTDDNKNIGRQEYEYSLCAKACGIQMEETRLFASKKCEGYFGTKRFDRGRDADGTEIRRHMISASALLETSQRIPNLDYDTLMKLTIKLTEDFLQLENLYRLMCFNVFSHNRDDHSKNFTYLYDEKNGKWELSPAYDLTYSNSLGGEHATTVHGNGADPRLKDLLAVTFTCKMSPPAVELPNRYVRYERERGLVRENFFGSPINSLPQTSDTYCKKRKKIYFLGGEYYEN